MDTCCRALLRSAVSGGLRAVHGVLLGAVYRVLLENVTHHGAVAGASAFEGTGEHGETF